MAAMKYKILLLLFGSLLMMLFSACEWGNLTAGYEIVGVPDRIIYIANVDTMLDLTGLKIIATERDGAVQEGSFGGVITEEIESDRFLPWRLIHEIDFTRPGVYEVEIYYEWTDIGFTRFQDKDMVLSHKFLIQVIDDEIYYGFKEGQD
jgi:hypothetical protein